MGELERIVNVVGNLLVTLVGAWLLFKVGGFIDTLGEVIRKDNRKDKP